jgi:hypothetical protein
MSNDKITSDTEIASTDDQSGKESVNEIDDQDIEKVQSSLKKIAEKKPEVLEMMALQMQIGSMGHPLHSKMNEEHVSQVIELAAKHDERSYELINKSQQNEFDEKKAIRWFSFFGFLIIVALVIIVLFLFRENPNVLIPILTGIGGLTTGFLGGYGYSKHKE